MIMRSLCSFVLLVFLSAFAAAPARAADGAPRLVSLAPSLTCMVFDLGAGDLLVGVTDHCRQPPEAQAIAKVGGYMTPNFEAILALRPDIVLTLAEHSPSHPTLDALSLRYVVFDHRSLDGVLDSLAELGDICGVPAKGKELRAILAQAFEPPERGADETAPTLLFLVGRDYGRGAIANAYAIGRDGLYDALIRAVGCDNAYAGGQAYPVLSGEGVASLDPDIVVEAVYAEMGAPMARDDLLKDWADLANLRAVRRGAVRYIRSDYVFLPGMRLLLLKRDLERIVAEAGRAPGGRP